MKFPINIPNVFSTAISSETHWNEFKLKHLCVIPYQINIVALYKPNLVKFDLICNLWDKEPFACKIFNKRSGNLIHRTLNMIENAVLKFQVSNVIEPDPIFLTPIFSSLCCQQQSKLLLFNKMNQFCLMGDIGELVKMATMRWPWPQNKSLWVTACPHCKNKYCVIEVHSRKVCETTPKMFIKFMHRFWLTHKSAINFLGMCQYLKLNIFTARSAKNTVQEQLCQNNDHNFAN